MDGEATEGLHEIVLRDAFRNCLNDSKQIHFVTSDAKRICFNQNLFLLFSSNLRTIHNSLPPEAKIREEPMIVLVPETSSKTVMLLESLMMKGYADKVISSESEEILVVAAELGINISSLQGASGTKIEKPSISAPIAPPVETPSTVSKPQEKSQLVDKIMKSLDAPEPPIKVKKEPISEDTPMPSVPTTNNEAPMEKVPNVGQAVQPPTISETAAPSVDKSSTEPPKEFQCLKCQKAFDNPMHLRSHYCLHFKLILKKRFNNLSPDNKCTECAKQPIFASSDRLLLHIGVHHRKIDDILAAKGIPIPSVMELPKIKKQETLSEAPETSPNSQSPSKMNDEKSSELGKQLMKSPAVQKSPMPSFTPKRANENVSSPETSITKEPPPQSTSSAEIKKVVPSKEESRVNEELKCEICNQEQKTIQQLEQHCCRHFMKDLKEQYSSFIDKDKCKICSNVFKQQQSLLLHIGCKHGKINDILKQKGYAALPCPVIANPSASMQKKLQMKIKQEKQDHDESQSSFSGLDDSMTSDVGSVISQASSSIEFPTVRDDPDLQAILNKYKLTTTAV